MTQTMTFLLQRKVMLVAVAVFAVAATTSLVSMQLTDEVDWGVFDFAALGVLVLGTGLLIEVAMAAFRSAMARVVIGGLLAVAAALVFVELAVGLIGTPFAGS